MQLKPGDMLYYAPHRATGVLIHSAAGRWHYSLRSPISADSAGPCYLCVSQSLGEDIVEAIENGDLEYYPQ